MHHSRWGHAFSLDQYQRGGGGWVGEIRRFRNTTDKIKVILSVIKPGEKLTGAEIARRIRKLGYKVNEGHIKMFIYYHMLHKYLSKENMRGVNYYFLNSGVYNRNN
ncbi:MAG: hypothetical protein DRN88_04265 [Candidatus Hydrothermarchaeota archaeon]|nr:MAG: hypothetical protein DRN88_04265 [Candidatus Hydrothermarchaeota archaeon]